MGSTWVKNVSSLERYETGDGGMPVPLDEVETAQTQGSIPNKAVPTATASLATTSEADRTLKVVATITMAGMAK